MAKIMEFKTGAGSDIFFRVIFSFIFSLISFFLFFIDRNYRKEKIFRTRRYINKHPFKVLSVLAFFGIAYGLYYIFCLAIARFNILFYFSG
jgi:uncharacterized membrane protein YsdA (DUF1294 family)